MAGGKIYGVTAVMSLNGSVLARTWPLAAVGSDAGILTYRYADLTITLIAPRRDSDT